MKTITFLLLLIQFQLTGCQNDNQINSSNNTSTASLQKENSPTLIPSNPKPPIPPPLKDSITQHYHFKSIEAAQDTQTYHNLISRMENTFQEIEQFAGQKSTLPKITVYLYPSAEKKGMAIKNTDQNSIDFQKNETHIVFNEVYTDNLLQLENQILIRHLLGKTSTKALETGLGIYFTQNWQQKGYAYWVSKLHLSDNMPPLKHLLQNQVLEQGSPLMMGAMSGVFAAFLLKKWGKEVFLKKYVKANFEEQEISNLESEWLQFLDKFSSSYKEQITADHLQKKEKISSLPYFKGFNFAHEGYNIYDGYGSQEATKALTALQQIGTNTIAIVPYSGMKSPHKLQSTDIRLWRKAGTENDESVVHSAFQAKKLGMNTVLKPQLWIHNSWPGDVDFKTNQEWQVFFERYNHWIMHYALLAEMYDFEAFCVGVEFVKATLKHPEKWRKIILQVKKLYGGSVTYAANWGEEFEKNTLWNVVDFIGINCYYPLSQKENPSDKELQMGFEGTLDKIEAVAQKFNKKITFTEIGFRSIEKPWISPHHYEWGDNPNFKEEDQKRCYEAVMKGLQNKNWCQGILWWKWPSYLAHSRQDKTEFAPNGKMAEEVILKWFKE
ncbi:MAG: glycoside hydrolase family 113 [Chitinophagales bacterium]